MAKYPTLQNFPWTLTVKAVKESENFNSYADFYQNLQSDLPINSLETRRKYSNVIQRRFFPSRSLNDLAATVWKTYHDDQILLEVMRSLALESEPLIGDFVTQYILVRTPGSSLNTQILKDYIIDIYGELQTDSFRRMSTALQDMGFLKKYDKDLFIQSFPSPVNGFLILLHDRLARVPRIVRLSEILEAGWWRFLGLQDELQLRDTLRQAEAAELIARYSKVDELEQVTTRYSKDEYFQRALRL